MRLSRRGACGQVDLLCWRQRLVSCAAERRALTLSPLRRARRAKESNGFPFCFRSFSVRCFCLNFLPSFSREVSFFSPQPQPQKEWVLRGRSCIKYVDPVVRVDRKTSPIAPVSQAPVSVVRTVLVVWIFMNQRQTLAWSRIAKGSSSSRAKGANLSEVLLFPVHVG